MKNKLIDLNNHLFAQIERLGDEEMSDAALDKEVKRSEAIVRVADKIISGANTTLQAAKIVAEYGGQNMPDLPLLGIESKELKE